MNQNIIGTIRKSKKKKKKKNSNERWHSSSPACAGLSACWLAKPLPKHGDQADERGEAHASSMQGHPMCDMGQPLHLALAKKPELFWVGMEQGAAGGAVGCLCGVPHREGVTLLPPVSDLLRLLRYL